MSSNRYFLSLLLCSLLLTTTHIPLNTNMNDYLNTTNENLDSDKLSEDLKNYSETGEYPENSFTGKLFVLSDSQELPFTTTLPKIRLGTKYLHFVDHVTPRKVRQLALDPQIKTIIEDNKANFTRVFEDRSGVSTDSYQADDILRTRKVWEDYNINGSGVKIGIIDSGVDYGVSDLSKAAVIRPNGYTADIDLTGTGIGITSLTLNPVIKQGEEVLELQDLSLSVWIGERGTLSSTEDLGIQLQDLTISDIPIKSKSGNYKIGLAAQTSLVSGIPDQYFIFVLVDGTVSNQYDTLYVDFDTSLAISLVQSGDILPSGRTYLNLTDFDLGDEQPFGPNNPIVARDITGDGINDVSLGALGAVLDLNLVSNGPLVTGIKEDGQAIGVIYDSVGHGTRTSSAALSRGKTNFPIFDNPTTETIENSTTFNLPGSAPGASMISAKGFSLFDFFLGWLWTAGLELQVNENNELVFVENPALLVDISSNSWGSGIVGENQLIRGMDFYSLFIDYLSASNTIYEGYPGIIFVVGSGNGAPGYGTAARPAMSSMAITVGASTYYHFLNGSTGANDVAWFSSRGPTPYGTIKPDIITPGHTGFTNHQVIQGKGNGTYASGIFGGTSESTPRASGVIALMIQSYRQKGLSSNLEKIRLGIKSTAQDLGFHPTQQGAGLVDAYSSVSTILDNEILIGSTYSSQVAGEFLQNAYQKQFGDTLNHPLIDNPILDFITVVTPNMIENGIDIFLTYSNGSLIDIGDYNANIQQLRLSEQSLFNISSSSSLVDVNIGNMLPSSWKNNGLLEIGLTFTEESWNNLSRTGLQTPNLLLYDSLSGDIVTDLTSFTTWSQILFVGNPQEDFLGDPHLQFEDPGYAEQVSEWQGLTYQVRARSFNYQPWSELNLNENNGFVSIDGSVMSELQFGSLFIDVEGYDLIRAPIVITATKSAEFGDDILPIGNSLSEEYPYQQNKITNNFDWGFRPESGEFRYYNIETPSNSNFLAIYAEWSELGLIPNLYLFNSTGDLIINSDVIYRGNGFYESSTSEPTRQNLIIPVKDERYTLLVHVTEFPFKPGPFQLDIYARYLTLETLPPPIPTFSQDLQSQITGNLMIDVSNYSINQFPELKITSIKTMVFQGKNGSVEKTLVSDVLDSNAVEEPFGFDSFDDFSFIEFNAGDKINLQLQWNASADFDFYVFHVEDTFSFKNDHLNGLGASVGTNFESARFDAEKSGSYVFLIDYLGGLEPSQSVNLTILYDARNGPILSSEGTLMNLNSSMFANGNYGLWMIFETNFNVFFELIKQAEFTNHASFDFEVLSPSDGEELSGDVTITWETSNEDIEVDVDLEIEGVIFSLVRGQNGSEFTFNSEVYPNGNANLVITATDGVFLQRSIISVILNNANPSELPDIVTTQNRSLNLIWIWGLISIILLVSRKKLVLNRVKKR